MRATLIVLIAIALTAAAGAAFFAQRLASQRQAEVTAERMAPSGAPVSLVEVLVAGVDIKPGTAIGRSAAQWQPWPESALRSEYLSVRLDAGDATTVDAARAARLKEIEGMSARRHIAAGEPLVTGKLFKTGSAGFMAGALGAGMRAVSVSVKAETAAAGFILPGDRVDVILAHDITKSLPRGAEEGLPQAGVVRHAAEVAVEDARVLAVDQTFATETKDKETAVVAKVVTLEVTPEEAQALAVARQMGDLQLVLRDIASAGQKTPGGGRTFVSDMAVSPSLATAVEMTSRPAQDAPAAAAPIVPEAEPAWTVNVVRGGQVQTVTGN